MKWFSVTFALLGTGSGVALFRIPNLDPRLRALLFLATTLGVITMAPVALRAAADTYRILSSWGVITAIRDFFRNDTHAPAVTRRNTIPIPPDAIQPQAPAPQNSTPSPEPARPVQKAQPRTPLPQDRSTITAAPVPTPTPRPILNWHITNETRDNIYIRFWSKDGRYVWPHPRRFYRARPGHPVVFTTRCYSTRQVVCFGAIPNDTTPATRRTYWGRGAHGHRPCRKCCYRCNGATIRKALCQ